MEKRSSDKREREKGTIEFNRGSRGWWVSVYPGVSISPSYLHINETGTRKGERGRRRGGGQAFDGDVAKVRKSGEHAAALIYEHGPVAISACPSRAPPSPPIIERYCVNRDQLAVVTTRRNGEPVVEPVEKERRKGEREI